MLAICENCGQPQPAGWRPGDLCVHCGRPVRRDVRCFWCARWTPSSGKFCRSCAAAVVEARLFGAARMLKDAGVDRFGVPKMLAEMDPGQFETFTNIYQRHAAILARHVDHLVFLESFLQHKSWSDELEEELIGELPWPEDRLAALSSPLDPAAYPVSGQRSREESLAVARGISSVSPFPLTRALALLVRLLLDDWEIRGEALQVLSSGNPLLRGEAAIALTNWRVVNGAGIGDDRSALIDALSACPLQPQAAAQLAMLRETAAEAPAEARFSKDPHIAFAVALASGDIDLLVAAEREMDPLKRHAAARRLVRLGNFTGVGDVLRQAGPTQRIELLRQIEYRKKGVPQLREALFEILAESDDREVRRFAGFVLLHGCLPGDAPRIALAARGDETVYQRILQTPAVPPEDLESVCAHLLRWNAFRASQWGMAEAAAKGRLPASFVPRHWVDAPDAAVKIELCKFAEMQLQQYADEDLHRFLIDVAFGGAGLAVQVQAWSCLYRWYKRSDPTGMGPLRIQTESLQRFFGSVPAFVRILTAFLGDGTDAVLRELFVREPLAKLLRYAEADVLPKIAQEPRATLQLAGALAAVMRNQECDLILRLACIDLLTLFAAAPELQPPIEDILISFRGTDLDHGVQTALARLSAP